MKRNVFVTVGAIILIAGVGMVGVEFTESTADARNCPPGKVPNQYGGGCVPTADSTTSGGELSTTNTTNVTNNSSNLPRQLWVGSLPTQTHPEVIQEIFRLNTSTGQIVDAIQLERPILISGMSLTRDQKIWVSGLRDGGLGRVNQSGTLEEFYNLEEEIVGLGWNWNQLWGTQRSNNGPLFVSLPNESKSLSYDAPARLVGVAFKRDEFDTFWGIVSGRQDEIIKFQLQRNSSGNVSGVQRKGTDFVSSGEFPELVGLTWNDNLDELMATRRNESGKREVIAIDPETGTASSLFELSLPVEFDFPFIAWGGRVISNQSLNIIKRISLESPPGSSMSSYPHIPIGAETLSDKIRLEDKMNITTTGAVNSLNGNRWNRLKAIVSELDDDWGSIRPRGRLLEPGRRNYAVNVTTVGFGTKDQVDVNMKGIGTEPDGDLYLLEEESMPLTRARRTSSVTYETPVVYEYDDETDEGKFRVTAFGPVVEANLDGPNIASSQINWAGPNPFPGQTFDQDFFYGPGGNPVDVGSTAIGAPGWDCEPQSVCFQGGGFTENDEVITIVSGGPPTFGVDSNPACPNSPSTSSGACATGARTIATDHSVVPELKWIQLVEPITRTWTDVDGNTFTDDTFENLRAEDTGEEIQGRDIDLFMGSFVSANGFTPRLKSVRYCGGEECE